MRRTSYPYVRGFGDLALVAAPTGVAITAVGLLAHGKIDAAHAGVLGLAPLLAAIALVSPSILIVAAIALPPTLLAQVLPPAPFLNLILVGVLASWIARRGRSVLPTGTALATFGALVTAAALYRAPDLTATTNAAAQRMLSAFVVYLTLGALACALVKGGALTLRSLTWSVLLGTTGTGAILLAQTGTNVSSLVLTAPGAPLEPGLLAHRTHFGYLMAFGFSVAFARLLLLRRRRGRERALLSFFTVFLGVMVGVSFTRGAWLVALTLLVVLPWLAGVRRYILLLPLVLIVFNSVELVRERAFGDVGGGLSQSIVSGSFGSHRAQLWETLWYRAVELPWGGGFGHTWSFTPHQLFGVADVFVSDRSPFVYPHNDFLFLMIEFGIPGALLLAAFWLTLAQSLVALLRRVDARSSGFVLIGPLLTMFVAQLVDNGFAMHGLAERFFIFAGVVLGLASIRSADASISP